MITSLDITQRPIGNALFNYAILLRVADETGFDPVYPLGEEFFRESSGCKIQQLHTGFHIPIRKEQACELSQKTLFEFEEKKNNEFYPSIFNIQDNTNIKGYFQNLSYYKDIEDIKPLFLDKIRIRANSIFYNLKLNPEKCVGVHIRRGDYLRQPRHPVLPLDYYEKAMTDFKGFQFLVFSDDYEWGKNNFNYKNVHPIPSNEDAFVDLCAFSLCAHQIIANSSFSWWGAILNNNLEKRVISPYIWIKGLDMNIWPKGWKKI